MKKILLYILISVIAIIYLASIFADDYYIADWFTTDDAFYYFKIAQNFSSGLGSTFDGISRANGYHPLWLFLVLPVFFFSGSGFFLPLRLVIFIQFLLSAGTAVLLYSYLKKRITPYASFLITLLWTLYFPLFNILTNGTEALLNAFAMTLFWVIFSEYSQDLAENKPYQKSLLIGIVALLSVLSRLDNVFLILVFGIWLGFKYLSSLHWKISWKNAVEAIKIELLFFAPTVFVLGIYLIINKLVVGTFMPLSGQVKKYWGTLPDTNYGSRIRGIGSFLGEFFSGDPNMGPWNLLLDPLYSLMDKLTVNYFFGTKSFSLGLILVFMILLLIGYVLGKEEKYYLQLVKEWSLIPLSLATLIHVSYYKLGGYLAPRSWYWVLESFLIVLAAGMIIESLLNVFKDRDKIISPLVSLALMISLALVVLNPYRRYLVNKMTSHKEADHYYIQKVEWLERNTEKGSIIGMTGAGSTSYFIKDHIIMNLDGLVNGYDYFLDLKSGNAVDYLKEHHVAYIFAHEYMMLETAPYKANFLEILSRSEIVDIFDEKMILWKLEY